MGPQSDFHQNFLVKTPRKINYQLRFGPNLLHDLAFLKNYIFHARFKSPDVTIKKKKLIITLERRCWELSASRQPTKTEYNTQSQVIIQPTETIQWQISYEYMKAHHVHDDEFSIENIYLGNPSLSKTVQHEIILGTPPYWRLTISVSSQNPKVTLIDKKIPEKR